MTTMTGDRRFLESMAMPAIWLKLLYRLLEAAGQCAAARGLSRAEYIRRALERMNRHARAALRAERFRAASSRVRQDSMRVNAEFDAIERDVE